MGMFEGLVGGFGKAYGAHQKEAAARTAKQGELEQTILGTLLGSDNPEVQMRAMQAMMQGASGMAMKNGGLAGFLGETEPDPAFASMFEYLRGMDKGTPGRAATPATPAAPDTYRNTDELVAGGGGDGGSRVATQTVTAGAPATPGSPAVAATTPEPLFRTSQQRELAAGVEDRATRTGEMSELGASKEQIMTGVHRVPQQRALQPPRPQIIKEQNQQLMVDPRTGETIQKYGAAPVRPGSTTPRNNEGYINAQAAGEQIENAILAQFGDLHVRQGSMSPQYPAILQMRDELAVDYGFQSYEDLQRNAATPRGEMGGGMGMPPGQGISGQGEEIDHQRMAELGSVIAGERAPTPEEQQFIRQYLQMYGDQLQP